MMEQQNNTIIYGEPKVSYHRLVLQNTLKINSLKKPSKWKNSNKEQYRRKRANFSDWEEVIKEISKALILPSVI